MAFKRQQELLWNMLKGALLNEKNRAASHSLHAMDLRHVVSFSSRCFCSQHTHVFGGSSPVQLLYPLLHLLRPMVCGSKL